MFLQESPKFMFIFLYFIIATFTNQLVLSKNEESNFEVPKIGKDLNEDYQFKKNHFGRYGKNANDSVRMLFSMVLNFQHTRKK